MILHGSAHQGGLYARSSQMLWGSGALYYPPPQPHSPIEIHYSLRGHNCHGLWCQACKWTKLWLQELERVIHLDYYRPSKRFHVHLQSLANPHSQIHLLKKDCSPVPRFKSFLTWTSELVFQPRTSEGWECSCKCITSCVACISSQPWPLWQYRKLWLWLLLSL